jgi:hypothetical protein
MPRTDTQSRWQPHRRRSPGTGPRRPLLGCCQFETITIGRSMMMHARAWTDDDDEGVDANDDEED